MNHVASSVMISQPSYPKSFRGVRLGDLHRMRRWWDSRRTVRHDNGGGGPGGTWQLSIDYDPVYYHVHSLKELSVIGDVD